MNSSTNSSTNSSNNNNSSKTLIKLMMNLLNADPQTVDKLLASELNSLSFVDREALNEEMHGVRSLAPTETPEMINNALLELQREINERLQIALLSVSSSSSSFSSSSFSSSSHFNGSGSSDPNNNDRIKHEYLTGILLASESSFSSSPSPSSPSSMNMNMKHPLPTKTKSSPSSSSPSSPSILSPQIRTLSEETTATISDDDNDNRNNNSNSNNINIGMNDSISSSSSNKYAYALSNKFRIKFLRAELFDVKQAAVRYLKCVDFLVDYFGVVALSRPLYMSDLDKNELKLLKAGRLQLMPSRDRFGRRIIVFLGAYGKGYSNFIKFKVCLYLIFQVASDDETTQRNGFVAIYSRHENDVRNFMELAMYQTESIKFFEAVPLRYSAFHCFLPDELNVLRGIMLNCVGKRTRLITRVHIVSSVMETFYKLRCFGIPTEDFPVTSSGSIKTKKLMKWIKFRSNIETNNPSNNKKTQQSQNKTQQQNNHPPPFLGIECPELKSVIFRNGGSAWDHPGNAQFRGILIRREHDREQQKTMAQKNAFLNGIIKESYADGLTFLQYDDGIECFVEIRDFTILRKKVFQALRDQSARRKRFETSSSSSTSTSSSSSRRTAVHQVNDSSTSVFMGLDNTHSAICATTTFLNFKRRKRSGE